MKSIQEFSLKKLLHSQKLEYWDYNRKKMEGQDLSEFCERLLLWFLYIFQQDPSVVLSARFGKI